MRKAVLGGVALLILASLAWAGGDPWKAKPMSQWSDKDVQDILQNSPWSKSGLQAQGAWRPDGMTAASGNVGIAGTGSDRSKTSAGATPDTPGGLEKNASASAAQASYSIFWWSSRTIRAASMRRAVLKGTMKEEDAENTVANTPDEYMVLVQGTNMDIFKLRGEKAFENVAYIEAKRTKQKISPSHVAFLKGGDGETVTGAVFYFPKKSANGEPTISSDEKEIDFFVQLGGSKLLTYFDPRKMVDAKGEDL
jgi:hypothetical protein